VKGLSVRKTRVDMDIVRSLYKLTREDPAADLAVTGWRRARPEVARWQQWWAKHKAAFAPPGP